MFIYLYIYIYIYKYIHVFVINLTYNNETIQNSRDEEIKNVLFIVKTKI